MSPNRVSTDFLEIPSIFYTKKHFVFLSTWFPFLGLITIANVAVTGTLLFKKDV